MSLGIHAQSAQPPLYYWFDSTTTLNGQVVWYGRNPELWKNKKPISAGTPFTLRYQDALLIFKPHKVKTY